MNEFFIIQEAPILRNASPMQQFISTINTLVVNILNMIAGSSNSNSIVNQIISDPLLLFPIGIFAVMGTIGILKRMLSRD